MIGHIKLHRKILDNPIWNHSELVHLFLTLLLSANYQDSKMMFKGEEITIKRGQFATGRFKLFALTGINSNNIPFHLKALERAGIISQITNNRFTLITINKYNDYQINKSTELPANYQPTTSQLPLTQL